MHKRIMTAAMAATVCLLLAGCASDHTNDLEYKQATSLPPLEVPPDLTAPDTQGSDMPVPAEQTAGSGQMVGNQENANGTAAATTEVLPQPKNVQVMRDGAMRWLVVQATPEQLWPQLSAFWKQQGLEVKRADPATGVMDTAWAQNLAEAPKGFLGKIFGGTEGAATRDKYHVRLERGTEPGTTEIYLTQYKVGEVVIGSTDGFNQTQWQDQPSDPAQVNEMLTRLLVFLGEPQKQAQTLVTQATAPAARAQLETGADGVPAVVVAEDFGHAWSRVGIALDKVGLVVDDQDRAKGVYYTHATDLVADAGGSDKSFFSSAFSSIGDKNSTPAPTTQIHVQDDGTTTRVTVLDASGQPDRSDKAKAILTKLTAELR